MKNKIRSSSMIAAPKSLNVKTDPKDSMSLTKNIL